VNIALEFLDAVSHIKAAFLIGIFPPRSYKQAEYFAIYVPGVQVPRKRRGIAKARAARTPPKATSTLFRVEPP
jgi:5,10-methylenetetrahydrofolate reductase